MRIGLAVLALSGCLAATAGEAATWSCPEQSAEPLQKVWFVISRCSAAGTYTTGGDPVGDGTVGSMQTNLCGSAQRAIRGVMVSSTSNNTGADSFVATWDQTTRRLMLATAGATGAPGTPLVQVAAGTSLDGYTLRMLAICQ
jgi:hypothetical protein